MLNIQDALKLGLIKQRENTQKKLATLMKERDEFAKKIKELEEFNIKAKNRISELSQKRDSLTSELAAKESAFENHPSIRQEKERYSTIPPNTSQYIYMSGMRYDMHEQLRQTNAQQLKLSLEHLRKTLPEGKVIDEIKKMITSIHEDMSREYPGLREGISHNTIQIEKLKIQKSPFDIKIEILEHEIDGLNIQLRDIENKVEAELTERMALAQSELHSRVRDVAQKITDTKEIRDIPIIPVNIVNPDTSKSVLFTEKQRSLSPEPLRSSSERDDLEKHEKLQRAISQALELARGIMHIDSLQFVELIESLNNAQKILQKSTSTRNINTESGI